MHDVWMAARLRWSSARASSSSLGRHSSALASSHVTVSCGAGEPPPEGARSRCRSWLMGVRRRLVASRSSWACRSCGTKKRAASQRRAGDHFCSLALAVYTITVYMMLWVMYNGSRRCSLPMEMDPEMIAVMLRSFS